VYKVWLKWSSEAPPASLYNNPQEVKNLAQSIVNDEFWGLDGIDISLETGIMYDIATNEKILNSLTIYIQDYFGSPSSTNK